MARLRKELPPELLENVLARSPVHVLCRLRLVCKGWNHVITQPGFASLRAHAPHRGSYIFTASTMAVSKRGGTGRLMRKERRAWEILDMAEKRVYIVTDAFIRDGLFHGVRKRDGEDDGWGRHKLDANGGLIYAMYSGDETPTPRHIVCNPVSKSFHQIPAPELRGDYRHDIVVMLVENATQSYKIITTEYRVLKRSSSRGVQLYDSRCKAWRKLCEVPANHCPRSCIFLEGIFYTLFEDTSQQPRPKKQPRPNKLYSCDLETGAWSYIKDVKLPQPTSYHKCMSSSLQLVVSLGRLFFVQYSGPFWEIECTVTIWEILLGEKVVTKVAEMPKFLMYDRDSVGQLEDVRGNPMVALGCEDSVIISSFLGHRVGWDMLTNRWHNLPPILSMHDPINLRGAGCHGLYAAPLDLDLREMSPHEQ